MSELVVSQISFDPQGIVIAYQRDPEDARAEGVLIAAHQISVDMRRAPQYIDAVNEITEKLSELLVDILDDFATADPVMPDLPEDDDDDKGMGWNGVEDGQQGAVRHSVDG